MAWLLGATESGNVGAISTQEKNQRRNKSTNISTNVKWIIWKGNKIFVGACLGSEVTRCITFMEFRHILDDLFRLLANPSWPDSQTLYSHHFLAPFRNAPRPIPWIDERIRGRNRLGESVNESGGRTDYANRRTNQIGQWLGSRNASDKQTDGIEYRADQDRDPDMTYVQLQ
jgi:hypothetical protein